MRTVQPFGDRILIKLLPIEETTASGLLVAPISAENSNKGEVVAVGEGTLLQDGTYKPISIEVGEVVMFNRGSGLSYSNGKDEYKIIPTRDVLCKVIEREEQND